MAVLCFGNLRVNVRRTARSGKGIQAPTPPKESVEAVLLEDPGEDLARRLAQISSEECDRLSNELSELSPEATGSLVTTTGSWTVADDEAESPEARILRKTTGPEVTAKSTEDAHVKEELGPVRVTVNSMDLNTKKPVNSLIDDDADGLSDISSNASPSLLALKRKKEKVAITPPMLPPAPTMPETTPSAGRETYGTMP